LDIKKHRLIGGVNKFDRQVKINTGSRCLVSARSYNKTFGRTLPNSKSTSLQTQHRRS